MGKQYKVDVNVHGNGVAVTLNYGSIPFDDWIFYFDPNDLFEKKQKAFNDAKAWAEMRVSQEKEKNRGKNGKKNS